MKDKNYRYIYIKGEKYEVDIKIYREIDKSRKYERYHTQKFNEHTLPLEDAILPSPDTTEETVMKKLLLEKLSEALNALPTEEYDLIHKIFFEGYSERSIAEELGITRQSVNERKKRILRKLRGMVGED